MNTLEAPMVLETIAALEIVCFKEKPLLRDSPSNELTFALRLKTVFPVYPGPVGVQSAQR
jgi:hypothetical protein